QAIAHQHRTEQAAAQRQAFDKWAVEQDRAFAAKHPDYFDDPALQKAAKQYVCETWGLTEQEVAEQWSTNPNLRNAGTQSMIYDAVRARADRAGLESKRVTPQAPPVLRPGIRSDAPTISETEFARLSAAIDDPNLPQRHKLRAAAQMLASQRSRGGNRSNGGAWL